jgi:hypothetical protein
MRMRAAKRAVAVAGIATLFAWTAVALADAPQPGTFAGETSQESGSVRFGVSPDGGLVTNFAALMSADCTREGKPNATIEVGLAPTKRIKVVDGIFQYVGGIELYDSAGTLIGSGQNGEVQGGFTSPTTASGTLRFEWRYLYNAGEAARGYTCRTGVVTFQAAPTTSTAPPGEGPSTPGGGKGGGGGGGGGAPGSSCVVPKLKGKKLKAAKRAIREGNCSPGRVVRRHSAVVRRGRVIAQKPAPGTRLQAGAKLRVVVSSGPKTARAQAR